MKIIFWGTPQTSVPFLDFLYQHANVLTVVTQTDKPSSRGQKIHKSPAKLFAEEKRIPVLQPNSLKDEKFISQLALLKPEVGIVIAYGKILPREVIRLFPNGMYNIHFSLLPHLRGGAPIQWSILHGDEKTGVTIFKISETLDSGNIIIQKAIGISPNDNAITLEEKLIPLGISALEELMSQIQNGKIKEKPQVGELTFAPLIKKEDAEIDWNKPAEEIARKVRALIRLGAFCRLPNDKILKIHCAELQNAPIQLPPKSLQEDAAIPKESGRDFSSQDLPGTLCGLEKGRGFFVKCDVGTLLIIKVQLEGKKEMDAWTFLQGSRLQIGERFK